MRSKTLIYVVAGVIVLADAILAAVSLIRDGPFGPAALLVKFILTFLLAYSLTKRWPPGRWIAAVLVGTGWLGSLVLGLTLLSESAYGFGLIALGFVYGWCFLALMSRRARKFFSPRY